MRFINRYLENLFFRRPRILNALHSLNLVSATTQTIPIELDALERYARGCRNALEIGTYQGVTAGRIAGVLRPAGLLYCVDPWPENRGKDNPCWAICQRHLERAGVKQRVRILRGYSREMVGQIPDNLDFAFIDGDHSWEGIQTDWAIVSGKITSRAFICLHDSLVPRGEEWRRTDSCSYFEQIIRNDHRFSVIETVHSLAVLQKNT